LLTRDALAKVGEIGSVGTLFALGDNPAAPLTETSKFARWPCPAPSDTARLGRMRNEPTRKQWYLKVRRR
jgi:hypothetical protein